MRESPPINLKPARFRAFRRALTHLIVGLSIVGTARAQVGTGGLAFLGDHVVRESIASTAPVVQMSGGLNFVLALRADGSVAAWGQNNLGQCAVPVGITNATQVAAGRYHSVVLLADGTVRAFGFDNSGQTEVPAGLTNVVQVAAGDYFSAALKKDGTVVHWGFGGTLLDPPAGLTGVTQIAAGEIHLIARKSNGTVVCWGSNLHGESGVPAGLTNVVSVAAGFEHSMALCSDGTVKVWGSDNNPIFQPPAGLGGVKQIATGATHCMALKNDGSVAAWGLDPNGETNVPGNLKPVTMIGAGTNASYAADATGGVFGWGDSDCGETIIPNGLYDAAQITAGWNHVLVLRHDGSLFAWGRNSNGQCNVPVHAGNPYNFLSAGASHSAVSGSQFVPESLFGGDYAHQLDVPLSLGSSINRYWAAGDVTYVHQIVGGVKAYGPNDQGQLGLAGNGDFTQIVGGRYFVLGLRADGTVVGAGANGVGQINIPTGLNNAIQLAAAESHSLALRSDSTVIGWGTNSVGESTPPSGLSGVVQIGAGAENSLALKSDGTVVAWGGNSLGQTAGVSLLTGISQIGVGSYFEVFLPKVSLSVAPYMVAGGQTATGTVYIPNPAPANGLTITLHSSSSSATVDDSVVIPEGATSATFTITTNDPGSTTQAVITASFGSLSQQALLTVQAPAFKLTTSAPSVVGGSTQNIKITATLPAPAPAGGASIVVTSSDPSVVPQSPMVVLANKQTVQLTLPHFRVHTPTVVTLTGTYNGTTWPITFTVNPFQVTALSLSPVQLVSGTTTTMSVHINQPSTIPIDVLVNSSNGTLFPSMVTVTVPPSTTIGKVDETVGSTPVTTSLTLVATLDGSTVTHTATVVPAVTLKPSTSQVVGGSTTAINLTVKLATPAPTEGTTVTLASSDPSVTLPGTVTFTSGQQTLTVPLEHDRVHLTTPVTLSASCGTSTTTAKFTVIPFQVTALKLTPTAVNGGAPTTGKVTLNATPRAPVDVNVGSSNTSVVPGSVAITVPANTTSGAASISTNLVTAATTVTLTASLDGVKFDASQAKLTVDPALAMVHFTGASQYGGTLATGTLSLTHPAPADGYTISLTATNGTLVSNTVTVAGGATSATFKVYVADVTAPDTMTINATLGGQTITGSTNLLANVVTSMVVSPTTFVGNSAQLVTATITLSATAGYDLPIGGTSNFPLIATLPSNFVVPAGSKSVTIGLIHGPTSKKTVVILMATRPGSVKKVSVTVTP